MAFRIQVSLYICPESTSLVHSNPSTKPRFEFHSVAKCFALKPNKTVKIALLHLQLDIHGANWSSCENVDAKTPPFSKRHSDRNCGTKLRIAFEIVDSSVGVEWGARDTHKKKQKELWQKLQNIHWQWKMLMSFSSIRGAFDASEKEHGQV